MHPHRPHRALAALLLLLAVAVATPAAEGPAPTPAPTPIIAAADLVPRLAASDRPLILDVRTPEEFQAGHIPGAINIPKDDLAKRLAELEPARSKPLVVHCQGGGRAAACEQVLRDAGFTGVLHLEGDMRAWKAAGHPVEK